MRNKRMKNQQGGFIGFIIMVIILLVILNYFHFSLHEFLLWLKGEVQGVL